MVARTEAAENPALEELYAGFRREGLVPLWTEIGNLMPTKPHPTARPHRWSWGSLLPLAESAGELAAVGRGGERRAIALANPGLGGRPFATPMLWAAIQYLGRGEVASPHRYTAGPRDRRLHPHRLAAWVSERVRSRGVAHRWYNLDPTRHYLPNVRSGSYARGRCVTRR
ncbi:hypothetical protein Mth01_46720 [Sphaerimonospora thailandensis]|uniref:Uncharacterized protein n=1 Tax=Sphaerimonospora thailandensis TaxID=795644 RepID=A0A8J3RCX3_9ACTN|nr:hypothetical protein Mth01_46720 [Sphaerimonospora thailandensis]